MIIVECENITLISGDKEVFKWIYLEFVAGRNSLYDIRFPVSKEIIKVLVNSKENKTILKIINKIREKYGYL